MISLRKVINPTFDEVYEITKLWYDEWIKKEDGWTFEESLFYVRSLCQENKLPILVVAENETELMGVCAISLSDLNVRQDLYPDIINLYVKEKYRGHRLSEKLLNFIGSEVKKLGYSTVYLYTEFDNLYDKLGWKYIGKVDTVHLKPRFQNLYKKEDFE